MLEGIIIIRIVDVGIAVPVMVDLHDICAILMQFGSILHFGALANVIITISEMLFGIDRLERGEVPVDVEARFSDLNHRFCNVLLAGTGRQRGQAILFFDLNTPSAPGFWQVERAEIVIGIDQRPLEVATLESEHQADVGIAQPNGILML